MGIGKWFFAGMPSRGSGQRPGQRAGQCVGHPPFPPYNVFLLPAAILLAPRRGAPPPLGWAGLGWAPAHGALIHCMCKRGNSQPQKARSLPARKSGSGRGLAATNGQWIRRRHQKGWLGSTLGNRLWAAQECHFLRTEDSTCLHTRMRRVRMAVSVTLAFPHEVPMKFSGFAAQPRGAPAPRRSSTAPPQDRGARSSGRICISGWCTRGLRAWPVGHLYGMGERSHMTNTPLAHYGCCTKHGHLQTSFRSTPGGTVCLAKEPGDL